MAPLSGWIIEPAGGEVVGAAIGSQFNDGAAAAAAAVNSSATDFAVDRNGTAYPVPNGATGPVPNVNSAENVTGTQYTGGAGGANGQVSTLRLMDPTPARGASPGYPSGYATYSNPLNQSIYRKNYPA